MSQRTFLIGECASAHDGNLEKALRLIDAAADAVCDAAKFQFWSNATRLADRRRAPEYLEIYLRYAMPAWWLPRLRARADARGIEFMCTTFLSEDIATVDPFVERFKISSFEAKDSGFILAHQRFEKPVIISRGMQDGQQVWNLGVEVSQLQCTSAYPCPLEDLNLGVFRRGGFDGLSDHSGLIETGALAVAAGAKILEVHLKLPDTDPDNPDAGEFALLPDALADYVAFVRQAEQMLGTGVKRVMDSEKAMARYQVRA